MKSMTLTPDELTNVLSQVDTTAGYYSYDQEIGELQYRGDIVAQIEAADKTIRVIPVPLAITPVQLRKALRQAGIKAAFDAWLAGQNDDVKDDVEYALEIRRSSSRIADGATALGLTSAQVDDLFRLAKTL